MGSVMDQERPWERDAKTEGATLRERIKNVLRDKNRLHETVEQIICELERLEAMIADRPATGKEGELIRDLVKALRPFANMMPDDVQPKDALQLALQKWCQQARSALTRAGYGGDNG